MRKLSGACSIALVIIIVQFLFTQKTRAIQDPGHAAGQTQNALLPLANLAIPPSLGKMEERFQGTGSRWIIYIQDVHAHLTAQENIAAILEHLNTLYGIRTVALEGAWSATSFPKTWALPVSREKQMLARALLEDDYLTGPAYAAIFSPIPFNLIGMEDKDLYEQNRKIYLEHLAKRVDIAARIDTLKKNIEQTKTSVFNPNLAAFDAILQKFRTGDKPEKFIPALLDWTQRERVNIQDLQQMSIFKELLEAEKSIAKEKLKSEAERLLKESGHPRLSLEELLKSGTLTGEKLKFYPETQKYSKLLELQGRLSYHAFFGELEEAVRRLKEKLFANGEERRLDARSEKLFTAKKILLFEATPEDIKFFEAAKPDFLSDLEPAGLGDALGLALRFYGIVQKRDQIFFDKLNSDKRFEGNVAVVTGGFHTQGLSQRLAQAGISYMVITPDLGNEPANDSLYRQRLSGDSLQRQTLSELRDRLATIDDGFGRGVEQLRTTKNIRAAVQTVLSFREALPAEPEKTPEDFSFLQAQPEKRLAIVRDYLKMVRTGTETVIIVIKASTLKELFNDRVAMAVWQNEILSQRKNTIVILQDIDELLTESIGGKAVVKRVTGKKLDTVVAKELTKQADKKKLIGVIDAGYANRNVLVLPPNPVTLLLIRPMLEYGDSRIAAGNPEILALVHQLLVEIYSREGILKAA